MGELITGIEDILHPAGITMMLSSRRFGGQPERRAIEELWYRQAAAEQLLLGGEAAEGLSIPCPAARRNNIIIEEVQSMKRSEINSRIAEAREFFAEHCFHLPAWAYWNPAEWKGKRTSCEEVVENMLGWDLTDFGQGRYDQRGLLLFTIRNGKVGRDAKPYAEKIMIVGEDQETPLHYHWHKMEDIINRGGGRLVLELYRANDKDELSNEPVTVKIDGVERTVAAGEKVVLTPGESICLEQKVYHRFYGEKGRGTVLVGEVSQVNDDNEDNRFFEDLGRFPSIEEDEAPLHLLVTDYPDYL